MSQTKKRHLRKRHSRRSTIISLDVECVAGSKHHLDLQKYPHSRIPATVCVVDVQNNVLVDDIIDVPKKDIVSYLTPLTGLDEHSFKNAQPLQRILKKVYACCGPDTIIVGQNPSGDLEWLQLKQGIHYKKVIDISEFYKVWNKRYGTFTKFSLQNTAMALLGMDMRGVHSAKKDAIAAMTLYNLWCTAAKTKGKQRKLKHILKRTHHPPSIVKQYMYSIDGVCMTSSSRWCRCQQSLN